MEPAADTRGKPTGNSHALIIGSSERQGVANQTLNVEIATKNVVPGQLSVVVSDQFNKTYGARITDNGDSTFTCSFTPSFSGRYSVDILLEDNPIGGSPVTFTAVDVPGTVPTRREYGRASTTSSTTMPQSASSVPSLAPKSRELEEVKTQREDQVRKERAPVSGGSQTYREPSATTEKPKKKKKTR